MREFLRLFLFVPVFVVLSCEKEVIKYIDTPEITKKEDIECVKVYGTGETYCSFTSLVKRNDTYYLAFREGKSHVAPGDYGVIRVLKSSDASTWTLIQTVSKALYDLRDPNLSIMPDGKLLLLCGARKLREDGRSETRTCYSIELDNEKFDAPLEVNLPTMDNTGLISWIWRLTWFQGIGYGVCYKTDDDTNFYLTFLKTTNGKDFEYISEIPLSAVPSEAKVGFLKNGTCIAFIRCDLDKANGYLAVSKPPYNDWTFKILDIHIAGHDFLIENDENVILVTRQTFNVGASTCMFWGDIDGNLRWSYRFPSRLKGDDTSYAGIIDDGDRYVISYHTMERMDKPGVFVVLFPKSLIPFLKEESK